MANINYGEIPETSRQDLLAILYSMTVHDLKDPAIRADCERWKKERRARLAAAGKEGKDGSSLAIE